MDEAKSILVRRWLTKAKRDLASAYKLSVEPDEYLDTAIYHCQQAAEKSLKGFLVFHDHRVKKTHNISLLVSEAADYEKGFSHFLDIAERLTSYAEEFRYPDEQLEPSGEEFQHAYQAANAIYTFAVDVLPPEVHP